MAPSVEDRDWLRGELQSFLGARVPTTPPRMEIVSSVPDNGFVRHLVQIATDDGDVIPAFLAVPDGEGPFPAVVIFHQHAGQRQFGKSEVFGIVGDEFQAFGPALARAGLVVLAPDSIAFEDRRPGGAGTDARGDDWDQHYNALTYRLVNGDTLMRKVLDDAAVAVSVLRARPDVDADMVGVVGHSYGGNTVLFSMAVDERIRFGCASGALASYRRKIADGTGIELAQVIPGFAARFDLDDVLATIASRRLLVVSGSEDKYAADAAELLARAKPAYDAADAASEFTHVQVSGGHALEAERFEAILEWVVETAHDRQSRSDDNPAWRGSDSSCRGPRS